MAESPSPMPDRTWAVQLIQVSQSELETVYLPYASGLLQAYALRHAAHLGRYTFLPFLCDRLPLESAHRHVQIADVFGFSTYVWNMEYSLALARMIKAAKPDALIVFGGPQVPDRAEAFLRAHPFIDVCVHGEGERVFLKLLESLPHRNWEGIEGISWLDKGEFRHAPPAPRIVDLDEIPSPYLMGLFDHLLARPGYDWIVMWESNRGCPYSCAFCDWGSATAAKVRRYSMERIKAEIDWFAARRISVLSCCDANFGLLPRDVEIADYVIETRRRTGYPNSFCIQNAKNATERSYAIQSKFIREGMMGLVTLSLQSLSPEVLRRIKRENISLETYRVLQERFQRDGVATYTDLLIGLPGETYESFADGIARTISEGQHHWISFYNVFVLCNAELSQPEYRRRYGLQIVRIPYFESWIPLNQQVPEWQEMLIGDDGYSPEDWLRMRTLAWWVLILYYNYKLLQLPLLLLNSMAELPWRSLFEFFSEARFREAPMLTDLHGFLRQQALQLMQGKVQQLDKGPQPRWQHMEDFLFQGLRAPRIGQAFFAEIRQALAQLAAQGKALPPGLLDEAIDLSEALLLSPVLQRAIDIKGRYNLWDWYQGALAGDPPELRAEPCRYVRPATGQPSFELKVERPAFTGRLAQPSFGRRQPSWPGG